MKNLATLKLARKVTNSFKSSARYLSAVKSEEIIFNSPCKPLEIPTKNVTDFVLNRFITCQQPILNSESTKLCQEMFFVLFFNEVEVFDCDQNT